MTLFYHQLFDCNLFLAALLPLWNILGIGPTQDFTDIRQTFYHWVTSLAYLFFILRQSLTVLPRLTSHVWSFCLSLPAGILGMQHHTQLGNKSIIKSGLQCSLVSQAHHKGPCQGLPGKPTPGLCHSPRLAGSDPVGHRRGQQRYTDEQLHAVWLDPAPWRLPEHSGVSLKMQGCWGSSFSKIFLLICLPDIMPAFSIHHEEFVPVRDVSYFFFSHSSPILSTPYPSYLKSMASIFALYSRSLFFFVLSFLFPSLIN